MGTTITKHIANTVDNLRDSSGGTHELNSAYLNGQDINDIIPNKGEVKTLNRIAIKGSTGGSNITWYYPVLKLPADNDGNYASAIRTGRFGGWGAGNRSYRQYLI